MTIPTVDIIRAWTDEDYRRNLSQDDRVHLPTHPAGDIALTDADIQAICGNDPAMVEYWWTDYCYTTHCSETTYCHTTGPCCWQ